MRILLDTSPLQNANSGRGVGTYTRELLSAFQQATFDEEFLVDATHELSEKPQYSRYSLIHYPYFDLFFSTLPKPGKVPVVVTIHDVIPLIFPEHYQPGVRGKLRFHLQKQKLQGVKAVITDSQISKRDIVRHLSVPEERVHVVPLAASSRLQPQSEYFQEKLTQAFRLPEKYVVYVGDINYNKNLPALLLSLTALPDVHLVVVSKTFKNVSIPEGKQLAEIVRENSLSERVHVIDIPTDEPDTLAAVLAGSRALIQPSLYEGFGLPVLEAMQVGAVVVSTTGGSLPEVAGEAALLVEPTLAGLQAGIEEAWSLRGEERRQRIEAGMAWAQRFRWEHTARQTYEVYRTVLRERA